MAGAGPPCTTKPGRTITTTGRTWLKTITSTGRTWRASIRNVRAPGRRSEQNAKASGRRPTREGSRRQSSPVARRRRQHHLNKDGARRRRRLRLSRAEPRRCSNRQPLRQRPAKQAPEVPGHRATSPAGIVGGALNLRSSGQALAPVLSPVIRVEVQSAPLVRAGAAAVVAKQRRQESKAEMRS